MHLFAKIVLLMKFK